MRQTNLAERIDSAAVQEAANWRPTALLLPEGLAFEEWEKIGATLGTIERGVNWWVGDWLNYGESAYGEKYAQAVEGSGWKLQSLINMASVAGRIPPARRKESLSWSCHRVVAYLEPAQQERLLDEAESKGWGSRDIEAAAKALRKEVPATPKKEAPPAPTSEENNLPARVDSAEPAAAVVELDLDTRPEGDLLAELESADAEIRELRTLVDSLQTTDHGRAIADWALRYNQLEGRLRQSITEANEAKRQAKYQADLLKKIRSTLGVERDRDILSRLMERAV